MGYRTQITWKRFMLRTLTAVYQHCRTSPVGLLLAFQPCSTIGFGLKNMNETIAVGCRKSGRHHVIILSGLLAAVTLFPFPLKAQQSPAQEISSHEVAPTFKLQSERNVVTVRVVVRNKQGGAIDNLGKEDFQLSDRGKKQAIVQLHRG